MHLTITPCFKPGDLPPDDYLGWHAWADVQREAGIKQAQCAHCAKWYTPQELSSEIHESHVTDSHGRPRVIKSPVCSKCHETRNSNSQT